MVYRRHTRKRKRRMLGGKAGRIERIIDLDDATVVGAGSYGIVLTLSTNEVVKLFKDTTACNEMKTEARIQYKCSKLFEGSEIGVPNITLYKSRPVKYKNTHYLCGIGMDYLQPPDDYDEQVHIVLGYDGEDIDSSWPMNTGYPISPENPTRGFFASADTMESIWEEEGSDMTIAKMSYLMGSGFRSMIDAGIVPIDLEWVWSRGRPWIIDFGLCYEGRVEPNAFLKKGGSDGLTTDFYWPRNEYFYKGYFGN